MAFGEVTQHKTRVMRILPKQLVTSNQIRDGPENSKASLGDVVKFSINGIQFVLKKQKKQDPSL